MVLLRLKAIIHFVKRTIEPRNFAEVVALFAKTCKDKRTTCEVNVCNLSMIVKCL